jgi:hypothetical protein
MGLIRRDRAGVDDGDVSGVERREVVCASEDAAKAEAKRQQAAEVDARAEWIYLRNRAGEWVARRVDMNPTPQPMSLKEAVKEEGIRLLNPFGWDGF